MNSPFKTNFQSQHGQSLVSVLISVAIMGIVMMAFVSMMMSQQREITKVNQKMASLDIQRVLTAALANSSNVCNYMVTTSSLQNPAFTSFNPSNLGTAGAPSFNFTEIPMNGVAGSPPAVSVSTTIRASPLSNSLFVNSISLTNFVCSSPPCTALTNQFTANLTVAFDSSKLTMGLAPLSFPVTITSSGTTTTSQTITGCQVDNAISPSTIAHAFDASTQSTNGGATNCSNPAVQGPMAIFPNESLSFTLSRPSVLLIHYNAGLYKLTTDAVYGTGMVYLYLDGNLISQGNASLAPGFAETQTVDGITSASIAIGTHVFSASHSVDCGTVYWFGRALTVNTIN